MDPLRPSSRISALGLAVGAALVLLLPSCDEQSPLSTAVPPAAPAVVPASPAVTPRPTAAPELVVTCQAEPRSGEVPLAVTLRAYPAGGTGSYDFVWQFGDGEGSTQVHPTHTYTTAGVFDAAVTVTSGAQVRGCDKTVTVTGTSVTPAPAPGGSPAPLPDLVITIVANNGGMSYAPSLADARVGQHVVWRNADFTFHTASADGGSFDTGVLAPGASSGRILVTAPGTFPYHCNVHPSMTATLRVAP